MTTGVFVLIAISLILVAVIFELVERVTKLSLRNFFIILFGVIVSLVISALITIPISNLPGLFGEYLPIIVTGLLMIGFVVYFWRRRMAVNKWIDGVNKYLAIIKNLGGSVIHHSGEAAVDTSVLIDGRLGDIAKTGFLQFKVIVPRFVLAELQTIADSEDSDRRAKGRRGLDVLEKIRSKKELKVEIVNDDFPQINEVDAKLVALARKRGAYLLTTDFNLNKVAKAEGVKVLNINELSQSLRPVILPGEEIELKIVHEGKERGQGVGYLPDGTMIVVEKGDSNLNKSVKVKITRVLQTAAGKMFFSKILK
jgi:uncharacterized protein YacL